MYVSFRFPKTLFHLLFIFLFFWFPCVFLSHGRYAAWLMCAFSEHIAKLLISKDNVEAACIVVALDKCYFLHSLDRPRRVSLSPTQTVRVA